MYARHIELDLNGAVVHQYQSSRLMRGSANSVTDEFGRIALMDENRGIEVIDSELNLVQSLPVVKSAGHNSLHRNTKRNELVGMLSPDGQTNLFSIFNFTE